VKNEPEARADPRSDPPPKNRSFIVKDPQGIEGNTPIEVLGRFLQGLSRFRIGWKGFLPFFFLQGIAQTEQGPPPALHRKLSTSTSEGNLILRDLSETRDSSSGTGEQPSSPSLSISNLSRSSSISPRGVESSRWKGCVQGSSF